MIKFIKGEWFVVTMITFSLIMLSGCLYQKHLWNIKYSHLLQAKK